MKIHFIAIGGSIMHQLAIALQQQGYQITGSDDTIFDPAKTNLFNVGLLPDEFGWFPEKINALPDAVILGMHAKKDNPELLRAQQLGVPVLSYPEFIYRHAQDKTRVVIGGSHGKTTITSMVMHVLRHFGADFDYVVGAKLPEFAESVRLSASAKVIVIEGDEYLSSPVDLKPKFLYYRPHIALLSGIAWDHMNVFPTFETYLQQFTLFAQTIEPGGTLVYNAEDDNLRHIAQQHPQLNLLPYQTPPYRVNPHNDSCQLQWNGTDIPLQIFGQHNLQNLMGAKNVCNCLQIPDEQFFEAISGFTGAARRLELVAKSARCSVYKDFAHAPSKVKATTHALKSLHPGRSLIACLELHTYSSLNHHFLPQYHHTLQNADMAMVFYDPQTLAIKQLPPLKPQEIQHYFNHPNLLVFTNPTDMENQLLQTNFEQTDLLLMSSGNFGGINIANIAKFATGNTL
ncbi:peptidoglycan synthetase [Sphingobacteriales bacterium UPWRP_1]|nr:peptidoglycan synthetase [Sphingobacteriales bacterium TSM_CSS]PSJ79040.1 peptidoglycan synthetase [Sphingobacteriales bacterium UPWRP_1]